MKPNATSLFVCIIVFLNVSCTEKYSELSGHWISKDYLKGNSFFTVDFEKEVSHGWYSKEDSTYFFIVINKNSLTTDGGEKAYLSPYNNTFEFFLGHDYEPHLMKLKNDTLYVVGEYYSGVLFRTNESKTLYKELFNRTDVIVALPDATPDDSTVKSKPWSNVHLNIGHSRNDSISQDSTFINYLDVYIQLKDITKVVIRTKDVLPEDSRNDVMVFLHADRAVPAQLISSIINEVSKADSTTKIFRSYFDFKANKLYHRQLNPVQ